MSSMEFFSSNLIPLDEKVTSITRSFLANNDPPRSTTPIYNFETTLVLIFLINMIYIVQWKTGTTHADIEITVDSVVHKKQFHRIFLALLSHPPPSASVSSSSPPSDLETRDNTNTLFFPPREIPMGDVTRSPYIDADIHSPNRSWRHFFVRTLERIRVRITPPRYLPMEFFRRLWKSSFVSGLPLLLYISHIFWQCRVFEELYDLEYDRPNLVHWLRTVTTSDLPESSPTERFDTMMNNNNNNNNTMDMTNGYLSVEDQHWMIQHVASFQSISSSFSSILHPQYHQDKLASFSYYRVIIALAITSMAIQLLVSHFFLSHPRSRLQSRGRFIRWNQPFLSSLLSSPSSSPSSSHFTATESSPHSWIHQGICSMTPVAIALLLLHSYSFPNVSIPLLPMIPFSSHASLPSSSFRVASIRRILLTLILSRLANRLHPQGGWINGVLAGLLWNGKITLFLGQFYWGWWFLILYVFTSALSFKACSCSTPSSSSLTTTITTATTNLIVTSPLNSTRRINRNRISIWISSMGRRLISWCFVWIDYVSWDEQGHMIGMVT